MCLAAVKLESVQLTRTGHGIFFSALWFHPVAGEGHRCGWWGEEQSGRPFPPPPPPAENYLRPASRWGFAVSRYTRGARTPARGARVRVRSNFTCNFAVEGGPRRMAGFLIISSCSRPGAILTGNNSTYGNSAIDIAGRRSICRSIETKQKWNFLLLASVILSLSLLSSNIERILRRNAARIITSKVRELGYRRGGGGNNWLISSEAYFDCIVYLYLVGSIKSIISTNTVSILSLLNPILWYRVILIERDSFPYIVSLKSSLLSRKEKE